MGERVVSKESRERITVDPNVLLAQAQELARYIEALQNALAAAEATRTNIRTAIETIEAVSQEGGELLVPADTGGTAYFKAKPLDKEKVIVHLGGEYYASLPVDQAREKLEKRLDAVEKQEAELRKKLEEATRQYQAIQSLLQQLAIAARQAQQARPAKKESS